jgi:DNA-binding response OmpR family regulator
MSDAPKGRVNLEKAVVLLLSPPGGMELLVRVFHGFGVRHPYRCSDARKAMETCRETDLDLIICDGSLPGGKAYDFIADLRRSDLEPNRYTPVMVIQGHTPADQIIQARDCGANFVVAKPITPRLLLERVLWIANEQRPFIELDTYIGPDRRFQNHGPPGGPGTGRRRTDKAEAAKTAIDPKESIL